MRGAGRRFRHEGDAPVTDSSGRPRKRLRFFSYIVAKRLTAGPMADCNGSVVRHRGRAELVSQTAQRPLGSSLILSVSLVPCRAQARDAVALEIAFPGEEFVDRSLYTRQASSTGIRPLRTAKTRAALRRIVHRSLRAGSSGTANACVVCVKSKLSLMPGIRPRRV